MNTLLAIFIGGGFGSLARYGTGRLVSGLLPLNFPYGTLTANVISSLILGIFIGATAGKTDQENPLRFLIAIGFCGGFSTFSAFSAETVELFRNEMFVYGSLNVVLNLGASMLMIISGVWFGKSF